MSLSDLIKKGGLRVPATATVATVATVDEKQARSVAEVAGVAVADPQTHGTGDIGEQAKSKPEIADAGDPSEGQILAVLIDSTVLGAPIWFALRDDWKPDEGDTTPVFYASELPMLRNKTPEQLRSIFRVKTTFGPGSPVRQ